MSYEAELLFATNLAREAGEIMRGGLGNSKTSWKADNTPVTEADTSINQLVIESVKQAYPDDGILGEEASYEQQRSRTWVVDPIDGTQAFDLGVPVATFCLGLVVNDTPVVGVVFDPFLERIYTAVKGQGAFCNGKSLQLSKSENVKQNYIVLSSRINESHQTIGQIIDTVSEAGAKYFNFRSVVYGFMRVVSGNAVAAVAGPSHPWDIAAAQVIIEEAGATVTDLDGNQINYADVSNGAVVSNGLVHQQVLHLIRPKI